MQVPHHANMHMMSHGIQPCMFKCPNAAAIARAACYNKLQDQTPRTRH
jgi:hypothetical protein